jgi:hypothetical protein
MPAAKDSSFGYDDAADGNLVATQGFFGFLQRQAHIFLVIC